MENKVMKVVVWNEYTSSQKHGACRRAYPDTMHETLASIFKGYDDIEVSTATFDMPDCGLPDEKLNSTDVLIWWGHCIHDKVPDALVDKIVQRVNDGMGIIFLHSAHFSKPFKKLMGTHCSLTYREAREAERVWITDPRHPIAAGVKQGFRINHEEMYGEPFDIPEPDSVVFTGWFQGGNIFRSGCTYTRGKGKIFYFQPGHETYPVYHEKNVRKIIFNAADWAGGRGKVASDYTPNPQCPWEARKEKIVRWRIF